MRKRAAVAVVLVALGAWLATGRGPRSASPGSAASDHREAHSRREAAPPSPIEVRPPTLALPGEDGGAETPRAAVRSRSPLESYLASSVYPPTSRPLRRTDTDLIAFRERHERARPAARAPDWRVLFTADRAWLTGDEPLMLLVAIEGPGGRPPRSTPTLTLSSRTGEAASVALATVDPARSDASTKRLAESLVARGHGGGALHVAIVDAARLRALGLVAEEPTTLRFEATVPLDGEVETRGLNVPWTPNAPGRFTGTFTDAVVDGSLVVEAEAEIVRGGRYLVDANLHDAAGEPVAWTRFKGELTPGRHRVPLRFFGKVLRNRQARGPFVVGELRGALYLERHDPNLARMAPFEGTYRTTDHAPDAFSDAAWSSSQKDRTIAKLSALEENPDAPSVYGAPR